ncbi:MAG: hypothetical protein ACRC6I_15215 [Paracoccaceae bacterium]
MRPSLRLREPGYCADSRTAAGPLIADIFWHSDDHWTADHSAGDVAVK